jgi:hypothetical protein
MRGTLAVVLALGISFEDEVLEQFDGPSASVADEAGQFGAVSDVADPDRMPALLPEIAPRLPPILRGLEGLGSEALVALLLFAPDAPLVPGAMPLLQSGIDVRRLEGDRYVMSSEVFAGPGTVVFGLIGDRFVVPTDREWARRAAELEVTWSGERIELATGFKLQRLGETVAQLEASTEGLEGALRVEVPEGLD